MKNTLFFIGLFFVGCVTIGCTKGGGLSGVNGITYTVTSSATSKQLIPSVDTTSTGTVAGTYDDQTNILNYTLSWADFFRDSVFSAALNKNIAAPKDTLSTIKFYGTASATDSGKLARTISLVNTNKAGSLVLTLSGYLSLMNSEKADFLAGNWFIVLCTKRFPNGLVRGQIKAVKN
jgi:hypothetical protein